MDLTLNHHSTSITDESLLEPQTNPPAHTRNLTSLTMRFPTLPVIALFAARTAAQYGVPDFLSFNFDDPGVVQLIQGVENLNFYPVEPMAVQPIQVADESKFNPDAPRYVPPIQGAEDDAKVCDNGSGDGRSSRGCCLGKTEGATPDGGFVRVTKCRKCKMLFPCPRIHFF